MSDKSLWMVVPVRSFRDGKRRLAPVLDAAGRTALVQWLLTHTLDQAAAFPGWSQTLVVTACREVSAWVSDLGVRVLEESGTGGLNSALRQAQVTVAALGGSRMLVVSSDLPLLQAHDLQRLANAASDGVVALAPDRSEQGTNAMCLPVARRFDFEFGPDSLSRHRERAQVLQLESVLVRSRALAFDVDLPRDLSELDALIPFLRHRTNAGGFTPQNCDEV